MKRKKKKPHNGVGSKGKTSIQFREVEDIVSRTITAYNKYLIKAMRELRISEDRSEKVILLTMENMRKDGE
jgi:hypothetical protein